MEDSSRSDDESSPSWLEDALRPHKDDDEIEGGETLNAGHGRPSLRSSSIKDEIASAGDELDDESFLSTLPDVPASGLRRSQPTVVSGPGAFAVSSSGASHVTTMSQRTETQFSITESEQVSNQHASVTETVPEAPQLSQATDHAYETTGELVPEADPVISIAAQEVPQEEVSDRNANDAMIHPEIPTVVGKAVDEEGRLRRKKRVRMFTLLLGIVAVVSIVTAVTVALRSRGGEEDDSFSTETPTMSPSASPTTSYESLVIDSLVESGVDVASILDNGQVDPLFVDQRRAILWLTETDKLELDLRPGTNSTNSTNSTEISPSDKLLERYAVLVVLFALAVDEPISYLAVFTSVCSWNFEGGVNGIYCDETGSVTSAWLARNNFAGTLATEIGVLSNLQDFAINDNGKVHSTIPSELFGIATLARLYFGTNEITGTIPIEIQNTPKLTFVALKNNMMTGTIPTELGLLTALGWLDLEGNDLGGPIPSEFGLLTILSSMNIHYNQVTSSIPSEVGNMSGLQHFGVFRNLLTGTLPTAFGRCQFLQRLNLFENQGITGTIPSEIGVLPLITMYIGDTGLTGTVPTSFRNATTLTDFVAYKSPLSGSVDDILCNRQDPLNVLYFDYCRQGEFEKSNVTCSCCSHCGGFFSLEPLSDYEGRD